MQLRLSKAVSGVEEVWRRLCGDNEMINGQLSVESLQDGLAKLGVRSCDRWKGHVTTLVPVKGEAL